VDAPLSAGAPLEVLHDVRDVHEVPVDADLLEPPVEHAAGGPDERAALEVLAVAGLLADHHHLRVLAALPEHRLGARSPQVARAAAGGRGGQPAAGADLRLSGHTA